MLKRLVAFMLMCVMLIIMIPTDLIAEEANGTLTNEDVAKDTDDENAANQVQTVDIVNGIVAVFEDNALPVPIGDQLTLKTLDDFDMDSPALYTCKILTNASGWSERSIYSQRVFNTGRYQREADILYVDPMWVIVRYDGELAYVKRRMITSIKTVDPETTPPFGTEKHQYAAVTSDIAEVRVGMSEEDASWVILNPGTTISILTFCGEWAVVNYWRSYAYIHISDLTDIRTVSPTDEALNDDTPIAAYTSYYEINDTKSIQNRIHNIALAVERLSIVLEPGETLNVNNLIGPYTLDNGYLKAGSLSEGTEVQSPGGGTCQVSSTLYNVMLQLPGLEITLRRSHGENGAPYMPMHVDSAVGNSEMNLIARNNYDFALRFEGYTTGDGAQCWLVYRVFDDEEAP